MYQQEEELYGDELDGDEDRNDGLNALVLSLFILRIELAMGGGIQQRHRLGSAQLDSRLQQQEEDSKEWKLIGDRKYFTVPGTRE